MASAALTFGMVALTEAPALARHAATPPAATPSTAPATNGEPLAQAVPRLEQAFAQHPADATVGAQLADAYIQAGRPDLALTVTGRLLQGGQRTAPVLYFQGVAYRDLNQHPAAITSLQQAEVADPTSSSILFALTGEYLQAGDMNDALREAKRNATFNPRDESAHLSYGMTLGIMRQFDPARSEFAAAATLAPQDPRPYILIGRTFLDANDPANALAAFSKASAVDPKNLDALSGMVASYVQGRNIPQAVNTLERVLPLTPDPKAKILVMGQEARLLVAVNQNALAEQSLMRAIQSYGNLPEAHIAYGDFLVAVGRNNEGRQQYMIATGADHRGVDGLTRLGNLAMRMNQPAEAVGTFAQVAILNPKSDTAYINLGQALLLQRDVNRATIAFRKAFALNHTPDALAGLATCDFASRNYHEAQQIFDALLTQANNYVANNPRLLFTMGRTYEETHQKDKARTAYQRLLLLVQKGSPEERIVRGYLAELDHSNTSRPAHPNAVHANKARH